MPIRPNPDDRSDTTGAQSRASSEEGSLAPEQNPTVGVDDVAPDDAAPDDAVPFQLRGFGGALFSTLATVLVSFHVYTGIFGAFPNLMQRSLHVALAAAIVALVATSKRSIPSRLSLPLAMLLAAPALASGAYIALFYEEIVTNPRFGYGVETTLLAWALIASLLIITARTVGWIVPALVLLVLSYPFISPILPGILRGPSFGTDTVARQLFATAEGIWGPITGVSAREIAAFVILGSFLMATGAGTFFINLARFVGGFARGGSAQVALIASTLFGMINGSATANASSTGTITIPMMKRQGYPPAFAAAVEGVASTGGQITPPVMGVTAFVMAELTATSYQTIAVAAIIPALAFLLCVAVGIYLHARKLQLAPLGASERPSIQEVLSPTDIIEFVGPVAVLIHLLFVQGRSAAFAATMSLVVLIALHLSISAIRRDRGWFERMSRAIVGAGRALATIAVLIATVQILASILAFTGLATRISGAIVAFGGQHFFLTLIISMIICTILGMELPAVGAYVLAAAVVAPALIGIGVDIIPAHFFALFFSILAAITPPICTTLFVTSAIAETRWVPASVYAVALGAAAWLIPFVIVYEPGVLLGVMTTDVFAVLTLLIGILFIAVATSGWVFRRLSWPLRLGFFLLGALAVAPIFLLSVAAVVIGAFIMLLLALHNVRRRKTLLMEPEKEVKQ